VADSVCHLETHHLDPGQSDIDSLASIVDATFR
jgi:hypothetical protein